MPIDDEIRLERDRLEKDIALRHQLNSVADLEDLLLRLTDVVESIRFNLRCEESRPFDEKQIDRIKWRERATRALQKHEMILGQVKRRRDMISRRETQR